MVGGACKQLKRDAILWKISFQTVDQLEENRRIWVDHLTSENFGSAIGGKWTGEVNGRVFCLSKRFPKPVVSQFVISFRICTFMGFAKACVPVPTYHLSMRDIAIYSMQYAQS